MSFSTNLPLPPEPAPGQPLSASWGVQLLRWCRANALTQVPGMFVSRSANGTSLRPQKVPAPGGGAAVLSNPFDLTIETSDGVEGAFVPGAVQNLVPTNMLEQVDVQEGTQSYAFVRVTTDGKQVQSCELMITGDAPVAPVPTKNSLPLQVDVLLHLVDYTPPSGDATVGTYTAYRVFYPATNVSLKPIEVFETSVDNPQPGGPAYDKWYTWQIGGT